MGSYILIILLMIVVAFKSNNMRNNIRAYRRKRNVFLKRYLIVGTSNIVLMIISILLYAYKMNFICLFFMSMVLILYNVESRYKEVYLNNIADCK